jgi:hypothetical protein
MHKGIISHIKEATEVIKGIPLYIKIVIKDTIKDSMKVIKDIIIITKVIKGDHGTLIQLMGAYHHHWRTLHLRITQLIKSS